MHLVSERSGSPPESQRIPSFQRHSGEGRRRECREARTGSSPRGTAWQSSSSSGTAGRCWKSPGGWASRHREKLHVEGLALSRVLLRSDEVGPERQLREEPCRAAQGDPKGSSFAKLTPAKLSVVRSHVNSYGRPQFGGASPLQLASQVVPAELLDGLSIGLVPVEEVMMKPGLIEL